MSFSQADRKLLQDLSQGAVSDANLEPLIHNQIHDLSHALTCKKTHTTVFLGSELAELESPSVFPLKTDGREFVRKIRNDEVVQGDLKSFNSFARRCLTL